MGRPMRIMEGVHRHPEINVRPVSARELQQRFQPGGRTLEALSIKLGPFLPHRDAFQFTNSFTFTGDELDQIHQRYRLVIDSIVGTNLLQPIKDVLSSLSVHVAGVRIGLPDLVIGTVVSDVQILLIKLLTDLIVDAAEFPAGRCGGMAFSGYDFYLLDWQVDGRLGVGTPSTEV